MKILDLSMFDNLSSNDLTTEQLKASLAESGNYLRDLVVSSTNDGNSFDQVERAVFQVLKKIGFGAMELLIKLQGTGDLGMEISSTERALSRNPNQSKTRIRSIFGEHTFQEYTYGAGINKKIDLRPISARLDLPEHQWSYLLQEFSQLFCVEQAFNQASRNLETVLGGRFSVDTLEHTSQRMGVEADAFLDALPVPATGVIEGACRHLVKDRMEQSGMRWTLEGARSMLNVRAVFQSAHWEAFCRQRITNQSTSTHPNRHLINDYQPLSLAC